MRGQTAVGRRFRHCLRAQTPVHVYSQSSESKVNVLSLCLQLLVPVHVYRRFGESCWSLRVMVWVIIWWEIRQLLLLLPAVLSIAWFSTGRTAVIDNSCVFNRHGPVLGPGRKVASCFVLSAEQHTLQHNIMSIKNMFLVYILPLQVLFMIIPHKICTRKHIYIFLVTCSSCPDQVAP